MGKKIAVYLLPPIGLVALFLIYDLLTISIIYGCQLLEHWDGGCFLLEVNF